MKTVLIRNGAWHYWLAREGGYRPEHDEPDLCTYMAAIGKTIVAGLFVAMVISIACGGTIYLLADFIGWFIAVLYWGWVPLEAPGMVFVMLVGCGIGALLFKCLCELLGMAVEHTPDFVPAAYESFRDKVCFKIRIE
jgi:hypothetical protein